MSTPMAQRSDDHSNNSSVAIGFPERSHHSLLIPEKLSLVESDVVLSLTSQSEEEILDTRRRAKLAGRFAWRIECACDAEVIGRADNVRGHNFRNGTGVNKSGVMAAARRQAKKVGCTPAVVFQNSRIFRLITEVEGAQSENSTKLQLLDEKGFYVASLAASDPHKVLLLFAEKKAALKRFRVTDAQRLLEREKLTKKESSLKAISSIRSASRTERFSYLKKLRSLLAECPDVDLLGRLGLQDCLDDVEDEIGNMYDEDVEKAIRKHWALTHQTATALSSISGFPEEDIERIISMMPDFISLAESKPQAWQKTGMK